ncbi:MAG: TIGR03790 family protein, partial [Planctomycetota bacterium]
AASASGIGENAVLIIDPADPVSMWLGNYYKNARSIPDANVLYMNPGSASWNTFVSTNLAALTGDIANRGIADHTSYVLIAPSTQFYVAAPGLVSDACWPVTRFSISTAYSLAFTTADIAGSSSTSSNRYFSANTSMIAFDSATSWLFGAPSSASSARRYYIGGLIGYTGTRGNSPQEIIAMIDRSVAAEGTRPPGTFYFMNNTADSARNVRAGQFSSVISALTGTLGQSASLVNGTLPTGSTSVLGIVSGFASADIINANMTIKPGAFCDHVTSYAATFDEPGQTKLSQWITKGATASSGTVEEPCNYTGKFPHSRLHAFYAQGATVGEAYFRSLEYTPYQSLLVGDALARPFAYVPVVSLTGLPVGNTSGTVVLTPAATTPNTAASIAGFTLLIDGKLQGTALPGGHFTLNTTLLHDGWHDVRVIAHDNQPNKTQGRWQGSFIVNNVGRSAGLTLPVNTGNMTSLLNANVNAAGAPLREIQLVHNGRVVASGRTAGTIQFRGRSLGAGPSTLRAVAVFADGNTVSSPPVNITLDSSAPISLPALPVAFGYTARLLPNQTCVVELPAVFAESPATAVFAITRSPSSATILGGTGPYRIIKSSPSASGLDRLSFTVLTASGLSAQATISVLYGSACPADFNSDGAVDFFDYDDFVQCFEGSSCPPGQSADFDGDGSIDFFDYDAFVEAFELGC